MWLLLAFVAVPMIEIALFITVGGAIGLGWTLLIVLATAMIGANLVRSQGSQEMIKLRKSFQTMQDPSEPLASGAMILFAGALLLTPGFFTDTVGFALLVPQVRAAVFKFAKSRIKVQSFSYGQSPQSQHPTHEDVIDGEFEHVDGDKRPTHPSGWTRH
ncbi:exlusion protein FxsA [Marivivens niveibacter]|uniref:Exlusion protein FxsA n=1 Tax=Marivivens niveibacter TaxID=1930667 RepID=A0A251X0J9_9RHOB|nr:FxsA family protein [Marivivens niveibacter]OUD09703.1 exlusion protein FxsA [Marivivens niveibacter]